MKDELEENKKGSGVSALFAATKMARETRGAKMALTNPYAHCSCRRHWQGAQTNPGQVKCDRKATGENRETLGGKTAYPIER